jgi:NAD(P)-dependent dehydrogenase (short-subunit alcohol dehydrogenase family)
MKEVSNLNNKSIIILGSTGLIVKSIVESFLELGADVIGVDLNDSLLKKQEKKFKDNSFKTICADITNLRQIRSLINSSSKKFKGIDAAVNVSYPKNKAFGTDLWDITLDNFSDNISRHLGGYFLFMRECAKYSIKEKRDFSLVNFSSIYGLIPPDFGLYKGTEMTLPAEYVAIKSAIQSLSKYISSYTKSSKFRVNCICPGGVLDGQDKLFIKRYNSLAHTKGMLNPKDITGLTAFLCSDDSRYIRGQNIVIDDGFSL